jgi:hypothetical protein
MSRRSRLFSVILAVALAGATRSASASEEGGRSGAAATRAGARTPGGRIEITPQTRRAIMLGFSYLSGNMKTHGRFSDAEGFPVATEALGGLAFLAGGQTDEEGEYREIVRNAVANLLKMQDERGYFSDPKSRMYGHGFATLFFAELYGMTGDRTQTVRRALKNAVSLIERSQGHEGGWDYEPNPGGSDTSVTVCQAMALRAARNLGIEVDGRVIRKAQDYIRRAQNTDGGFCYRMMGTTQLGRVSQFPRSAAGVCILHALSSGKQEDGARLQGGFDYLIKNYRGFNQFPYYADYYCAQALFQAGGRHWAEYYPYLREKLIGKQKRDGSWSGWGAEVTPQATAMALIALQVPSRYLPIVER